ncbi:ABC transporter permease subunit [Cohnella sp. CFH 77786]|uniref:ABC transporter permease n=1 Tax=Cohnella sp. CFH 77786 TaxID=2662265 RepID=UPI001C60A7F7|nr:ABC transporter permease subunit [Cohnella sp. CFH 77786]MBW5445519.1 ABC transporter permease subunit [Cohnella sp. CFH 77786]
MKSMLRQGRLFPAAAWVLGLMILWEAVSWFLLEWARVPLAQSKLPYLHEMVRSLGGYGAVLLKEGAATLGNAGLGFLMGTAAGALLAVLMSVSRTVENLAFPYAVASQMIPILGLAPIIYGIVRDEQVSRILISGYITFFPVSLGLLRGLRSVPPSALELMRACAAKPWEVYWKLRLPASLPSLFAGLKVAAPLAVTGAILVELMGARHGIGVLMLRNLYYGPSHAYLFWLTVMTGALLGIAVSWLIGAAERLAVPWQPEFRGRGGERG